MSIPIEFTQIFHYAYQLVADCVSSGNVGFWRFWRFFTENICLLQSKMTTRAVILEPNIKAAAGQLNNELKVAI